MCLLSSTYFEMLSPAVLGLLRSYTSSTDSSVSSIISRGSIESNVTDLIALESYISGDMVGESRAKHWCFTLNNYTGADETRLGGLVDGGTGVSFLCYGKEVGEENGTPHLQGFISFGSRQRFTQARDVVGGGAHLEVARHVERSITYCEKDGDFVSFGVRPGGQGSRSDLDTFKDAVKEGGLTLQDVRENHSDVYARYPRFCLEYMQDKAPPRALPAHPLRPWQEELNQLLNAAADDRTIMFVVDVVGNSGKTWFAHYYASLHSHVQVLQPGKKADMSYALDSTIRVLFVDAPRSKQGEFIQYDFLEDVKNGYVFSSKYESRVKQLNKVHVVVNMNEFPDMTKLSADRYMFINGAREGT